ncbi:MAG: YajG family lipoprotein [Desulfotalea sp.]
MRAIHTFTIGCTMMIAGNLTGCAVFDPIDIELAPEYSSTGLLHVDETKKVSLTVIDERPVKEIGLRGANNMGGEINVKGDVATLIKDSIQKRLEEGNFKVNNNDSSDTADLTIEIRHLNYKILTGVWSGTAKADSAMKAICTSVLGKVYQKFYTGEYEKKGVTAVPGKKEIPKIISKAVSNNLDNMANDKKLVDCLSGK